MFTVFTVSATSEFENSSCWKPDCMFTVFTVSATSEFENSNKQLKIFHVWDVQNRTWKMFSKFKFLNLSFWKPEFMFTFLPKIHLPGTAWRLKTTAEDGLTLRNNRSGPLDNSDKSLWPLDNFEKHFNTSFKLPPCSTWIFSASKKTKRVIHCQPT